MRSLGVVVVDIAIILLRFTGLSAKAKGKQGQDCRADSHGSRGPERSGKSNETLNSAKE